MSRKLKRVAIIVAAFLLIVGSLPFMGLTAKADTTATGKYGNDKMVLGVLKNTASIPAIMGDASGDFNKNNASVEVKIYNSNNELNTAIKNGEVNGAVTDLVSYASLVNTKANKNWKMVGSLPGYSGLVANKKYKSVKSLKGKTVAIDKKDASKQYLVNILKKNKIKYSTGIKVKQIDSENDRVAALKNNEVDAAVLNDPAISNAKGNGAKILNRQKTSVAHSNIFIVNNSFAKKNASSMGIIVYVMNKGIKTLNYSTTYGAAGNALRKMDYNDKGAKYLTDMEIDFPKIHKVKKSEFNSAFKYAKSHKLYKGKVNYKAHTLKVKGVK